MKLARFERSGRAAVGAVVSDHIYELGVEGSDIVGLLAAGAPTELVDRAERSSTPIPLSEARLLPPIQRPPKFLAIGLNYAEHAAEASVAVPAHPMFFNKQSTCVIGPGEAIRIPSVSKFVDYEGELGVVVGRTCSGVAAKDAHSFVAGYLAVNDVSVRDWQMRSPTWTLGKSFDTHGPIGPWIVTPDEVGDPHALRLRTILNGEVMQDASTGEMLFDIWTQIEMLSTACTLEPGDVIATGTPPGVGAGRDPMVFLRAGDVVEVEIERVGILSNPVEGPQ